MAAPYSLAWLRLAISNSASIGAASLPRCEKHSVRHVNGRAAILRQSHRLVGRQTSEQ
jgi:hypothetical protein